MNFFRDFFVKKTFVLALFCFAALFCPARGFAQELSGARLSDALADRLKKAGHSPQKQTLSSAWLADFPYNITLDFAAKEKSDLTIVLSIAQEDAWERESFSAGLLSRLSQAYLSCNVKVVFTAGDKPMISGNEKMSGSEIFCKSIEGDQNAAALVIGFGGKKNFVTPGSNQIIAPYWIARHLCDSLDKNSCPYEISGGTFLALYRLGALRNSARLYSFLEKNIPAILLTFGSEQDAPGARLDSIIDFCLNAAALDRSEWSGHYIPIKFLSKRYWLQESGILLSIFAFTTAALFFLADFGFLFRRRSKRLAQLKFKAFISNYLIFVTAALLTVSFALGQYIARGFESFGLRAPMVLFVIKLAPAFFIISSIYPLEFLRHKTISSYLYEYIISTSSILNIFIWTFIDISFFYLFAIEYIILTLSRIFKRTAFLAFFITLYLLPFMPLIYSVLVYSNIQTVRGLIFCGVKENIFLSFTLVPFNLLWLRILARMNFKANSLKNLLIRYGASGLCAMAFIATFSFVTITIMRKFIFQNVVLERRSVPIQEAAANVFSKVSVTDSEYYGGKIRRVEITCSAQPERSEVYVNGSAANPVYFSVYENESYGRITKFLLPDKPPKKFSVQYTPDPSDSEIVVINYFITEAASQKNGGQLCLRESFAFEAAASGKITERRSSK